ncbi:nitroreductase family protein [Desulfatiferula olefinivorans]
MMTFDDIIRGRRSVRRYTGEKPDRALIETMLESARFSPSPSHSQPVRFLLIESEKVRARLAERMQAGRDRLLAENEALSCSKKIRNLIRAYHRYSEFMIAAPCLLAVGTTRVVSLEDQLRTAGITPPGLKHHQDLDLTTGLSLSAFILKGTELGLSTCILTAPLVYLGPIGDLLGEDLRITCFVTAGFADEQPRPLERIPVTDLCRVL